jgi:drug/metabolite transporter (DMT)-like permease
MTHGVNPLGYSLWQSIGPTFLIGLLALTQNKKSPITPSQWQYYLICGLTGIAIPNTNMYFAAPHLPAGLLAVIVNTVPIMAYLMSLIARVESFNGLRLIAVMVALAGLMLILIPQASLPSHLMTPWILSALITPLCFAFCAVYMTRFRPKNSSSLSLAAGTLVFSSLLLSPIVILSGHFYAFHLPLTTPDWVILLEILLSSLGYILFFQLIKIAGPVYYSFVDTIVAITGLFWGYLIFDEHLNIWSGTAVILIIGALIIVNKQQKPMLD